MRLTGTSIVGFLRNMLVIVILILVGIYAVTGFFVLPPMVKSTFQAVVAEQTGRTLQVDKVSINPLLLCASVEGVSLPDEKGEVVFGFNRLFVDISALPLLSSKICIDNLILENPKIVVTRDVKGKWNFSDFLTKTTLDPPLTGESSPEPTVDLQGIEIKKGELTVIDRTISPKRRVELSRIDIMLKKRSSTGDTSHVEMRGIIAPHTPFTVSGDVDLSAAHPLRGIAVTANKIDLTRFSPHADRYVGRKIENGRMDLDLFYHIQGNTLKVSTQIVVNQFILGGKIENPHAFSLPCDLALGLLTNPNGEMHISLPMKGDLGDPEFCHTDMVKEGFTRFIRELTASPFTHLGKITDAGKDLGTIVFSPGEERIREDMEETFAHLSRALQDRPMLNLEIRGTVDPDRDRAALAEKKNESDIDDAALETLGMNRAERIRTVLMEKGLDESRIVLAEVAVRKTDGTGSIATSLTLKAKGK